MILMLYQNREPEAGKGKHPRRNKIFSISLTFFVLYNTLKASEAHPFVQWVLGGSFLGAKRPEVKPLCPSSTEVKNEWISAFTFAYTFAECRGTNLLYTVEPLITDTLINEHLQ
jgi:hypothetical protein